MIKSNLDLISVIVPVYNAEQFISRCIESILCQTYKNFELLLIDDGSIDHSGFICDQYICKDSRIKVFHKLNGGVSSARNVGLEKAKGKWITFADSDDWVEDNWLKTFIDNKDELVVQTFKTSNKIYNEIETQRGNICEVVKQLYDARVLGYCWCKLFEKDIIQANNLHFDENMTFREDEDFVLSYIRFIKSITYVNEPSYVYTLPSTGKYGNNNFYAIYSLYKKVISDVKFPTDLKIAYLNDCMGAILDMYDNGLTGTCECLHMLLSGNTRFLIRKSNISCIAKFLLSLNIYFGHWYFLLRKVFRKRLLNI